MNNRETITKLIWLFQSQRFADWYNSGEFDRYITGDLGHNVQISKEDAEKKIRSDIARMLRIEDTDKNPIEVAQVHLVGVKNASGDFHPILQAGVFLDVESAKAECVRRNEAELLIPIQFREVEWITQPVFVVPSK